jgi:hypothetical protein
LLKQNRRYYSYCYYSYCYVDVDDAVVVVVAEGPVSGDLGADAVVFGGLVAPAAAVSEAVVVVDSLDHAVVVVADGRRNRYYDDVVDDSAFWDPLDDSAAAAAAAGGCGGAVDEAFGDLVADTVAVAVVVVLASWGPVADVYVARVGDRGRHALLHLSAGLE